MAYISASDQLKASGLLTLTKQHMDKAVQAASILKSKEDEQIKVQQAYKTDLEEIAGLTKSGVLTDAEYEQIVKDQHNAAQEDGLIKAYENFSIINGLDKERAAKRVGVMAGYFKENMGKLTSVVDPMTIDDLGREAMQVFTQDQTKYKLLKDGTPEMLVPGQPTIISQDPKKPIGTDASGKPIFMDMKGATTGELIAFQQGIKKETLALQIAVQDVRHERAVEVATNQYGVNLGRELNSAFLMHSRDPEASAEIMKSVITHSTASKKQGVEGQNSLIWSSLESLSLGALSDVNPIDVPNITMAIDDFLDFIGETQFIEGNGSLAPEGTENHNKLRKLRNAVNTRASAIMTAADNARVTDGDLAYQVAQRSMNKMVSEIVKDGITPDEKIELATKILGMQKVTLDDGRVVQFNDVDKLYGTIDAVLTAASKEGYKDEVSQSVLYTTYQFINTNKYNLEALRKERADLYMEKRDDKGDIIEPKSLLTIEAKRALLDAAIDENPLKGTGLTFADIETASDISAKAVLKLDNGRMDVAPAESNNYVPSTVITGQKNDVPSPAMVRELNVFKLNNQDYIINGTPKGEDISVELTIDPTDHAILVQAGVLSAQQIMDKTSFLAKPLKLKDAVEGENLNQNIVATNLANYIEYQSVYAEVLALKALVVDITERAKVIEDKNN